MGLALLIVRPVGPVRRGAGSGIELGLRRQGRLQPELDASTGAAYERARPASGGMDGTGGGVREAPRRARKLRAHAMAVLPPVTVEEPAGAYALELAQGCRPSRGVAHASSARWPRVSRSARLGATVSRAG